MSSMKSSKEAFKMKYEVTAEISGKSFFLGEKLITSDAPILIDENEKEYLENISYFQFVITPIEEENAKDGPSGTDKEEDKETFPQHLGGGTYLLSNGKKIKGKGEATEAEALLKGEE